MSWKGSKMFRRSGIAGLAVAGALCIPLVSSSGAGASEDALKTTTFEFTGGSQSYTVPPSAVAVQIEASGASGGSYYFTNDFGGRGGEVRAIVPVTPGQTLQVNVGGKGDWYDNVVGHAGGWNGGGGTTAQGATGGGASDVRRGGTALANRIIVAGGGGGIGGGETPRGTGGAAGGAAGAKGASGECGDEGGYGGTQTAGGARGSVGVSNVGTASTAGSLGTGGNGGEGTGNFAENYGGGGGGGGYYGGGGGKGGSGYLSPLSYCNGGGGGGGSSYIASNAVNPVSTPGVNDGHGVVKITPLPPTADECPEGKEGTPPVCVDRQPVPGVPSDDCVVPATVVIDGYVGSLYSRLRVKQAGSETWVCARLQPEGGQEYAGGKFVASGSDSPVGADTSGGACASQSGFEHITGGNIDGQPYSLDSWNDDNEAWVCTVAMGLGARVMLDTSSASLPFQQDNPALATTPPRTVWTPGVASADCEAQPLGTKTRLVNAVIGGVQVWVTGWQSGSKTQLCFRTEGDGTAEGGRFTIDADPGIDPVLEIGADTTGCTRPVFSNDTAELEITRSENNDNPAAVCVTQGANTIRLTAGSTGSVNPNMVDFDRD